MSMNEDESAYGGSVSGTSSMRSSNVPEIAVKDGLGVPVGSSGRSGAEEDRIDVGLTVRLQHKLKETQFAKDKLEKRLEQLENRGKYHLDIILSTYDVFSLSMYFVKMGRKAISKFYNFFPLSNKTKLHQNHLLLCQLVSYIHCSISKFPSIHKWNVNMSARCKIGRVFLLELSYVVKYLQSSLLGLSSGASYFFLLPCPEA